MKDWRDGRWLKAAGAAALLVALLSGCGGGTSSLTGGSIPTVTRSGEVSGTVVSAEDLEAPLEGVEVIATLPDGTTKSTSTDAAGGFHFGALPEGDLQLDLVPRTGHGVHSHHLTVHVARDQQTAIAVPLAPLSGPPIPSLSGLLTVTPQSVTLRVDEFVDFRIRYPGMGPGGPPPLWVVEGNLGVVSPAGRFYALRPGRGRVLAMLGGRTASAEVVVVAPATE